MERCCVLSECKLGHEVSEGGDAAAIISPVEVVATEAKQDFSFHARPSTVLVVNQKQVLHEGFTTKQSAKPVTVEAITFDLQRGDYAGVHIIKHVQRALQLLHLQLSVHSVQMG